MKRAGREWNMPVAAALVAALLLLAAGIMMAAYEERLYSNQQIKDVREQAQILAASVSAAILFDDRGVAQEYVMALQANPELEAAAVYDQKGTVMAHFTREGARLPQGRVAPGTSFVGEHVNVAVAVTQDRAAIGTVYLSAATEPVARRVARYAGLILLVTMGALVIAVLGLSQAALKRRANELAVLNRQLQAEMEERRKTEEALRQSHKMEAIGQLSGGIAHDFNNLIMIVKGNLRLLRRKFGAEVEQAGNYVTSAEEALDRAAHLTQRILAFSRRQPLSPRQVMLSELVEGMGQLLRHSVGEQVTLTTRLEARWPARCDVNQMENVILNLAINARDAMPEGGTLEIVTRDVHLTDVPPGVEGESFVPGDYVALSLRDSGEGMPEEVRQRAVDPFFTTKPLGKGTGLGLSMTFGYVRQSGGYLLIDSAPGEGATITILMPRSMEESQT